MDSFNLREPYFSQVKYGEKTYEGRLFIGEWKNVSLGSTMTIVSEETKEMLDVKIVSITQAQSFKVLYETLGVKLLPKVESKFKGEEWRVYTDFYDVELEKVHGVVCVGFVLI